MRSLLGCPRPLAGFLIALIVISISAFARTSAQIPTTFTNLQVLPKDSTRAQVSSTMRTFASSLKVRCNYCHVGENPDTLENFDFASDTKETKRVARVMLRMTQDLNSKSLPETGRPAPIQVTCFMCHRGVARPQPLADLLYDVAVQNGVGAALERYTALRKQYADTGSYDFSAVTLRALSNRVTNDRKDLDGAIAILKAAAVLFPMDPETQFRLGDVYAQKGDKASALASFKKSLALDPTNDITRERIKQLGGGTIVDSDQEPFCAWLCA